MSLTSTFPKVYIYEKESTEGDNIVKRISLIRKSCFSWSLSFFSTSMFISRIYTKHFKNYMFFICLQNTQF